MKIIPASVFSLIYSVDVREPFVERDLNDPPTSARHSAGARAFLSQRRGRPETKQDKENRKGRALVPLRFPAGAENSP